MGLEGVENIVLVLSGKGGVGKSSTTLQLALTLSSLSLRVGVLDIDLTGPNIPRMFSCESSTVTQSPRGWLPVPVPGTDNSIRCMSLGFLLRSRGDSIVWRGPKKTAMVKQFLSDTVWTDEDGKGIDYLLIDTPPGTSDEHISLAEAMRELNPAGAVVVTTPQAVATADVRKELNFCKKVGIHVLGVVENMAGFVCPHCAECTDVFSRGGGEEMSKEFGVDFLGAVPIDPEFVGLVESQGREGEDGKIVPYLAESYKGCKLSEVYKGITEKVMERVEARKKQVQI